MKTTAFEPRIINKNKPDGQWKTIGEDAFFNTRDEAIQAGINYIEEYYDEPYTEWQKGPLKLVIAKVTVEYEDAVISVHDTVPVVTNIDECLEPRDYVAANLKEALIYVHNTGDWYGQLMNWCNFHLEGKDIKPNVVQKSKRASKCDCECHGTATIMHCVPCCDQTGVQFNKDETS